MLRAASTPSSRRATCRGRSRSSTALPRSVSASATATRTRWRSSERAERSSSLSGRGGSRAPRRGDCLGRVRRAAAVLDRGRLLHHDQLLSGRRRLLSGGERDRGREPLVRLLEVTGFPARAASIARRSCGSEESGPRRRAGDRRVRGALRLRPPHHGRRLLRDRRSAAAAATSPRQWRRTRRPTSWVERRSPVSRSCVCRGKVDGAVAAITRALEDTQDPLSRLRRCRRRSRSRSRRAT